MYLFLSHLDLFGLDGIPYNLELRKMMAFYSIFLLKYIMRELNRKTVLHNLKEGDLGVEICGRLGSVDFYPYIFG